VANARRDYNNGACGFDSHQKSKDICGGMADTPVVIRAHLFYTSPCTPVVTFFVVNAEESTTLF